MVKMTFDHFVFSAMSNVFVLATSSSVTVCVTKDQPPM